MLCLYFPRALNRLDGKIAAPTMYLGVTAIIAIGGLSNARIFREIST